MAVLCHMPLLRNPDKSKLSKRKNPTSILYYQQRGFLPQAVLNYLGRMGWSMPDESEKFSLAEMQAAFDIQRVSLGGPVFDVEKLSWLNGQWLRELSDEDFLSQLQGWLFNREHALKVIPHIKTRVETLGEVMPLAGFCFGDLPALKLEDFTHNKYSTEDMVQWLQCYTWSLEVLRGWERDQLFALEKQTADTFDVKISDFLFPVFIAIAGSAASLSVVDAMQVIGSDISRARLRNAIEVLGGLSKKKTKALEKQWQPVLNELIAQQMNEQKQ